MSRWRAPQPKSSPYITQSGFTKLRDELAAIWSRRANVTKALAAAAAEGDRSENAEYIYRKKELREIDRRIRYLQKRLPVLKVVPHVENRTHVYFGATVELADEQSRSVKYRIVGADEIDPDKGDISIDSPLAKALLKKTLDDEVHLALPEGQVTYWITAIE